MNRIVWPIVLLLGFLHLPGKEKLTLSQGLSLRSGTLSKPLPVIEDWVDDLQYLEIRDRKLFKVNAISGKASLFLDVEKFKTLDEMNLKLISTGKRSIDRERFPISSDVFLSPEDRTADWGRFAFIKNKHIYLFLRSTGQLRRISAVEEDEKNPKFSPDGDSLAYTSGGNIYVYDIRRDENRQLTHDGSEEILNGYASWIYYEEILGRASRYRAFWWSPNSRRIAFLRFDQSKVPVFPIFNSEGIYGTLEKQRYPKPGFPNPDAKLGVADLESGKLEWIELTEKEEFYLAFPLWNQRSDRIYFQWLNRRQNHMKIVSYDLPERMARTVYEERQNCWIDFYEGNDILLLSDESLLLRSSRDGWFHIYHVSGGVEKQLTSGPWSVKSIDFADSKKDLILFSAAKEDSTETDIYRVSFAGENPKRLTDFAGTHIVKVSKRGSYMIDRYSNIRTPVIMDLRDAGGHLLRRLGDSRSPEMDKYDLAKVELFRIPTGDGYRLPAVWYLPDLEPGRKYPVILFIYGGPAVPMVSNSFGRDWINHYLAQEGIIAMSVDHRGSGHFGKKGTDLMYRCLGKWEMNDYIQAVKYLRALPFVDPQRIGISGGSYGGYVAALALTYGAEYFTHGIAEFPVTDWKLYDSVYTERYMDTPAENPEGYKDSSVLTYIDRYKGNLFVSHGTMDDNVHMQNTLQFVGRMLDAGKKFDLMIYPGERHGFRGKKFSESQLAELDFWFRHFLGRPVEK